MSSKQECIDMLHTRYLIWRRARKELIKEFGPDGFSLLQLTERVRKISEEEEGVPSEDENRA